MARPPKQPSDFEWEDVPRVDSTIRPPPPRANASDLDLEDDAATRVLPLRWPEPPKDLAERLQAIRTDGVGLSRSVAASARSQWAWLWRSLAVAVIVGAMLRIVPLRALRAARSSAPVRPVPAALPAARAALLPPMPAPAMPLPAPPAPAAPLAAVVSPPAPLVATAASAAPAPSKPPIDVTSLPKAAPTSAPPRPAPRRVVKPIVRAPAPAADPAETGAHIDENAYDAPPGAKCRTCEKAENPY
jgi:hypothetical protein